MMLIVQDTQRCGRHQRRCRLHQYEDPGSVPGQVNHGALTSDHDRQREQDVSSAGRPPRRARPRSPRASRSRRTVRPRRRRARRPAGTRPRGPACHPSSTTLLAGIRAEQGLCRAVTPWSTALYRRAAHRPCTAITGVGERERVTLRPLWTDRFRAPSRAARVAADGGGQGVPAASPPALAGHSGVDVPPSIRRQLRSVGSSAVPRRQAGR